jgi:hypothetical protein
VQNPVHILMICPEIEQLITAWPNLPDNIKKAIKALVESYEKQKVTK